MTERVNIRIKTAIALILAAAIGGASMAAQALPFPAPVPPAHLQSGRDALTPIQYAWKRVWIGNTRASDRWRCQVVVGDTVFMSSDRLQSRARAKLAHLTDRYIYCRRTEPFIFWW